MHALRTGSFLCLLLLVNRTLGRTSRISNLRVLDHFWHERNGMLHFQLLRSLAHLLKNSFLFLGSVRNCSQAFPFGTWIVGVARVLLTRVHLAWYEYHSSDSGCQNQIFPNTVHMLCFSGQLPVKEWNQVEMNLIFKTLWLYSRFCHMSSRRHIKNSHCGLVTSGILSRCRSAQEAIYQPWFCTFVELTGGSITLLWKKLSFSVYGQFLMLVKHLVTSAHDFYTLFFFPCAIQLGDGLVECRSCSTWWCYC